MNLLISSVTHPLKKLLLDACKYVYMKLILQVYFYGLWFTLSVDQNIHV
jgi:hypothetical protein